MKISAGLPTGVAALLGDEARERRQLEAALVARLEERGFREVILPILDYFEPYGPLLTSRSREELYRFVDRDGQLLALRGDFTPMLARLLAPLLGNGHPLFGSEETIRLFYRGDVVRFQEARPGRLREYYQIGAELLGLPGGASKENEEARQEADEDALRLFLELLALTGEGRHYRVTLGCAGALDRLLLEPPAGLTSEVLAEAVARRDRELARRGEDPLLQVVELGVPEDLAALGDGAGSRVARLLELAEELKGEFSRAVASVRVDLAEYAANTLDPRLQLASSRWTYYDGLVFRAYADGSALPIGQGGRYDRLFGTLGAEVPAVGFQVGVDRVLAARWRSRGGAR